MNIKDYTYIVEIAKQGSLTAAADRLCITQSALTKFVQQIESELGTPLFYRRAKRFVLTPVGQLYVEKGEEIIRVDQTLRDEIQKLLISGADTIRLGFGMGFEDFILGRLLPAYFALPHTRSVSIYEVHSSRLLQQLEKGNLDLCLAYVNQFRPGLNYVPLQQIRTVLAVPKQSPLVESAVVREGFPYPVLEGDAWLREPYIRMAAFTRSGALAQAYFTKLGKWPNSRLYVKDVRSALRGVNFGLGNCIVTEPIYVHQNIVLLCLPDLMDSQQQVCIVTLKGAHLDDSLIKLQETIQALYKEED